MPLQMAQMQMQGGAGMGMIDGLDAQIKKAAHNHDDEVVTVMKEVQKLLKNGAAGGIVKYDPNQPRDERGRFAESGRDDVALKTLPNYEDAVIPDSKLTGYALNPDKSPDKAKAFKAALGYDINNA
ncbi:MAG: hypothetical protein LUE27_07180, partial [Clostridia bacterium]|nr:hypothetical protein [Clostridia bacterium]